MANPVVEPSAYGLPWTERVFRLLVRAGYMNWARGNGRMPVDEFLQKTAAVYSFSRFIRKANGWQQVPTDAIKAALMRQRKDTKSGGLRMTNRKRPKKRVKTCPHCGEKI